MVISVRIELTPLTTQSKTLPFRLTDQSLLLYHLSYRSIFLEANLGTAPSIKVLQTSALASWLVCHGTRGRIQTYDLPLRRRLLLFAELLGYMVGPLRFELRLSRL